MTTGQRLVYTESVPKPTQRHQMIAALPEFAMAIDPGDTCGYCRTWNLPALDEIHAHPDDNLAMYYEANSRPVAEFLLHLEGVLINERLDLLIVEEWRLFPDKIKAFTGKNVPTAEYIGAIKWLAAKHGAQVVEQGAWVKATMAAILKGRGFKSTGRDRHAKDAELHMWYYATRAERDQQAVKAFGSKEPF